MRFPSINSKYFFIGNLREKTQLNEILQRLRCRDGKEMYEKAFGKFNKTLQVSFTSVAIVLGSQNNSYTCRSFVKVTPAKLLLC